MYTTVSAGVLALDLARHPAGGALADLVDRALVLTPEDLSALSDAAAHDDRGPARRRLLKTAERSPRLADALSEVTQRLAASLNGATTVSLPATDLAARLVGRLHDLHALLIGESPLAEADAAAVGAVLDAVTAAWLQHDPEVAIVDAQQLRGPWEQAVPPFPGSTPAVGVDGATESLLSLLDAVARAGTEQWLELDRAHEAMYDGLDWSTAMHEGCREAAGSDRTLAVARWHLAAARTAHGTGLTRQLIAPGAMMSVVAAVQGTCVRDLLPAATTASLTGPCRAVLGWSG